jgi:hypothetical protein
MLAHAKDEGFLTAKMEDVLGESVARGQVHPFEPYREVHQMNLKLVHEHYKDKPLPEVSPPLSGSAPGR